MTELEAGLARLTGTGHLFDCLVAVQVALQAAKVDLSEDIDVCMVVYRQLVSCGGQEGATQDGPGGDKQRKLTYQEFPIFLQIINQYYHYCQVCKVVQCLHAKNCQKIFSNDDMEPEMEVCPADIFDPENVSVYRKWAGEHFDPAESFSTLLQDNKVGNGIIPCCF